MSNKEFPREIAAVVHALFEEPNIRFEDGPEVWIALNGYLESDGADLADALIINKAHAIAEAQGMELGFFRFSQ